VRDKVQCVHTRKGFKSSSVHSYIPVWLTTFHKLCTTFFKPPTQVPQLDIITLCPILLRTYQLTSSSVNMIQSTKTKDNCLQDHFQSYGRHPPISSGSLRHMDECASPIDSTSGKPLQTAYLKKDGVFAILYFSILNGSVLLSNVILSPIYSVRVCMLYHGTIRSQTCSALNSTNPTIKSVENKHLVNAHHYTSR
jgi:hypothetical protein